MTPLGLAARDVEFNTAWTFEKVELRLRKVLPILFHYFDSLSPRDDGLPHWALACCGQNRVAEVYPVTHPNGQNLHDIKGRHGRPVKECFIILGEHIHSHLANHLYIALTSPISSTCPDF